MKKGMKRLVAFLLVMTMLIGVETIAFAAKPADSGKNKEEKPVAQKVTYSDTLSVVIADESGKEMEKQRKIPLRKINRKPLKRPDNSAHFAVTGLFFVRFEVYNKDTEYNNRGGVLCQSIKCFPRRKCWRKFLVI